MSLRLAFHMCVLCVVFVDHIYMLHARNVVIYKHHTYFNIWPEAYLDVLFCVHVTLNVSTYTVVIKHMKKKSSD